LARALAALAIAIPSSAATKVDVDALAGLYVQRDGASEDVLEIVKVTPSAAYVRARLLFDNGHICSFHGLAKVQGASLVYTAAVMHPVWVSETRSLKTVPGTCRLTLTPDDKQIVFGDQDDVCTGSLDPRVSCGARGLWRGAAFDRTHRRPIRYMSRLLASREYTEAVSERRTKD
jgi:hypothetical protein